MHSVAVSKEWSLGADSSQPASKRMERLMQTDGDQTNDVTFTHRSTATVMAADTAEETVERAATVIERSLERRPSIWVYVYDPADDTISCVVSTEETGAEPSHPERIDRVRDALESNDICHPAGERTLVPVSDAGVFRVDSPAVPGSDSLRTLATVTVYSVRDRCHRRDQQRTVQRLQRERDQLRDFASIVSHDLRNPLSVARGNFELAVETAEEEYVQRVRDAHDRIESIIQHTLSHTAEPPPQVTSTDLEELARRSWESVPTEQAILEIDDSRSIDGDPDRLRQLFENLFRNAIEHGSTTASAESASDSLEDGRADDRRVVTVRVGSVPGGFYVEDDGPGIPEADRERVFQRGYSADPDGTGIGLSIVAAVADEHDFDVSITDGTDGGARFEFTLPD